MSPVGRCSGLRTESGREGERGLPEAWGRGCGVGERGRVGKAGRGTEPESGRQQGLQEDRLMLRAEMKGKKEAGTAMWACFIRNF